MKNRFCPGQFLRLCGGVALAAWLAVGAAVARAEQPFLEPEQAFQLTVAAGGRAGEVQLSWRIAPGYYLYRDRMTVSATPGGIVGKVTRPGGERKHDPNFGVVEVYHEGVTVVADASKATALQVGWQGCAEAGLCYPPQQRTVSLAGIGGASAGRSATTASTPTGTTGAAVPAQADPPWSESGITQWLGRRTLWWSVPVFLLLGIAMAFTPCVLPMVPIVSSMVAGSQAEPRRAFVLTLSFVLPMALVYAALGVAAALAGAGLQALLQNQWAILAFAGVFVALALSMFGFFELQLPVALRDRLAGAQPKGGSAAGAAAMGVLSALMVSPCMTAPLAGTLLYIAQSGNVLEGALLLFAMGLGMGLPLLVVGTLGARFLPRPGPWMNRVKGAFGFVLLGTAAWLVARVLAPHATLLLSGALLGSLAVTAWQLAAGGGRAGLAVRSAAMLGALWAGAMVFGAAAGGADPLRPLAPLVRAPAAAPAPEGQGVAAFETFTDPLALQARLDAARTAGQPALVDFSAAWCASCQTIDREVFGDPQVGKALAGVAVLRADVTASDAAQRALMRRHQVMGPPTVMLFDAQGRERRAQRLVGEFSARDLLARLAAGEPS
ncbi:protein-disulfide reductase DsbD [Ramlibacter sp.]|uniref:protein-disulfide reductase DsbD n=1 Tax=Ramlibacter sp. TaxID=1917967 RepID=UPI002D088635|nr:protein-disulfide reductase DsbD [Ramlibacter sp.]HWI83716.1 protein-disulfide reductase DsbD [Ramlibacter sp.]